VRLTRLALSRYGHLADVDLVFDPAKHLHIVLGANEAGKSTALAAIADALFGFGHKTAFAFQHKGQDLRLGVGVQAADGRSQFFWRRKGRADTLRDADDAVLAESTIAGFLAGASRERFTEIFGMDGTELRRGGAAILEGRGEIGESILQAHTGLLNVRSALRPLNEAALALYGDKRGGRAFHAAAEAFRSAKQDVEIRSVRPAQYEQATQARAQVQKARAANALEAEGLDGERVRLDRIRRTTPARLALLRDRAARAALGDVASLPEDAETLRSRAVQSRILLGLELQRAQAAQAQDEAALLAIGVDSDVLAQGAAIDELMADVNRIERAVIDRDMQQREAAQARRRMQEHAQRLGFVADADTLMARLPGAFLRAEAERAIAEHTRLAARRAQLASACQQASEAAIAARLRFAALATPEPVDALVAAVEVARSEGRIDGDCADAEDAAEAGRAALARALGAVPFWRGDAQALAQARMPLAADVAAREAALAAAESGLAERQREVARLDQARLTTEADLAAVLAVGAPPTADMVACARARRDRAWRVIHAVHVEHGASPSAADLADLPADLPAALSGLIGEADRLADRRTEEAERVATYEQKLGEQARLRVARAHEEAALGAAVAAFRSAEESWQALWASTGIEVGTPPQMHAFLARREAVIGALDDVAAKQRVTGRLHGRRALVLERLRAALGQMGEGAQDRVAPMLQAAAHRLREKEAAQLLYAETKRALGDREAARGEQDRRLQALDADLAGWSASWAPIAASLGLAESLGAPAGAEALSVWAEIDRHARDMRAAQQRISEMTADIEVFAARVAALCAACAPDLAAEGAGSAVRAAAGRLAQARAAADEQARLRTGMLDRGLRLAALGQEMTAASDALAGLRALAGVADDDALQVAIARAQQAALLDRATQERARELRRLDDGLSLEALSEEAAGADLDALAGRVAEIDVRRREIAAENEVFAGQLRDLETSLAGMERGHDAAEAAQRMRNAAAEAEEIAARYVRLRLSHTLLRAGIERFRRERQAPLLASAGAVFKDLTQGRYVTLATQEEEDGRMVVVALRPDGFACPAERLSEGTRDQLYLALRLAAIRAHAGQAEPLPFIADDLLASFDDRRARATLHALAEFGAVTQTILFTHHDHIAAMADMATTELHRLPLG
jgi:chromosome segregation protein